jgi:hypothetical protein
MHRLFRFLLERERERERVWMGTTDNQKEYVWIVDKRVWMGTTDNQRISNHKIFLPMVFYLSLWFGWYRVGIGIGMV